MSSNNDKAKQKLMESMRITKANSGKKIKEVDRRQNITPRDDKPVKQKKKTAATNKMSTDTQKPAVDLTRQCHVSGLINTNYSLIIVNQW